MIATSVIGLFVSVLDVHNEEPYKKSQVIVERINQQPKLSIEDTLTDFYKRYGFQ